jgi:glycosyltransferase involved in cell wall biosynthesis
MRPPTVSVNIAVKDRRDMLAACLDGLAQQTFTDFEVVVVDNGSTDGTREMAQARDDLPVRVLRCDGSLGAVRNAGVAASHGSIVAFVDSDCVPTPTWLAEGVAAFEGARVATVQGRTLPDPTAPPGPWPATQELTGFTGRYEACNLFYRRDALVDAGGFDEAIGFFGEDSMAGWAVKRLGFEERFAPGAVVHHAVTYPGVRWHWRRGLQYGHFNAIVRRFPEARSLLWNRLFLRKASAVTLAAMFGVLALLLGDGLWGVVLLVPFVATHLRRSPKEIVASMGFDIAVELGLLWGSIRERTLVL